MSANVRRTVQVREHTVDIDGGVIIVTTRPSGGGGYRVVSEVQYPCDSLGEIQACTEAINAVFAAEAHR